MTRYIALAAAVGVSALTPSHHHRPGCSKTFTVKMAERAIDVTFAGTRTVSRAQRRRLDFYTRCQRNPQARPFVRAYRQRAWQAWGRRRNPPLNGPVQASWFDDTGATACGTHYALGFATLLPIGCGQTITMRGPSGQLVQATREDAGPYVGGRTFDLNAGLKAALGCSDLCEVYYR